MKKLKGAAVDSVFLMFVNVITSLLGIVIAKLMSVYLTLEEYGTYSQAMLIVTSVAAVFRLGMTNAMNYFYNGKKDSKDVEQYIATMFGIQVITGTLSGIAIIALQIPIAQYFDNMQLRVVIAYVAFLPMFRNILPMLQVLFVSCGKAKSIAIRNLLVSIARLCVVALTCFATKDIRTILTMSILLDIIQVVYFTAVFAKERFPIRLSQFSKRLLPEILRFCLPMAVFVLAKELARDIDRLVISYYTDTATLAIYSTAAKHLPFDMVTTAFLTVLIPVITKRVGQGHYQDALKVYKAYIRMGYLTTWILVVGALVCADKLLIFLYDAKYAAGLPVFITYLLVEMFKFMNNSTIFVAKGKSKMPMILSISSMILNAAFSALAFRWMGIVGPAVVTLVVTIVMVIVVLILGARELNSSFWKLVDWKELLLLMAEMVVVGFIARKLLMLVAGITDVLFWQLVVGFGTFAGTVGLLNLRRLIACFKEINAVRQ